MHSQNQKYYQTMIKMGVHKDIKFFPNRIEKCSLCNCKFTEQTRLLLNCGHFMCDQCFEEQKKCAYPGCTNRNPTKKEFSLVNINKNNTSNVIQQNDLIQFNILYNLQNKSYNKKIKASSKLSDLLGDQYTKSYMNRYGQDQAILICGFKSCRYGKIKNQRIVDLQKRLGFINTNNKSNVNRIMIYQRSNGGGFPDEMLFNNLKEPVTIRFSQHAPEWRIVKSGLNLEGTCVNKNCRAINQRVWVQKGFGIFFLNKEAVISKCPICQEKIKDVINLGIYSCSMKVNGVTSQGQQVQKIYENLRENHNFLTFQDKAETKMNWKYIELNVKENGWNWQRQ